jgi:hypothetical protein
VSDAEIKRWLIVVEIVYFIVDGLLIIAYFRDPTPVLTGALFVASWLIGVVSTWLWFKRTD